MHVVSATQLDPQELPPGTLQDLNQTLSAQLESVAKAICKARRVVVVCGAGCSTGAGIPDFRSSTGLFKSLKDKHPRAGLTSGKDLFNASLFQSEANTALYYSMIAELCAMSRDAQPTAFHKLLKLLDEQGKLFRVYTQNIDALEAKAGLTFGLPPQQAGASSRGKKRKIGTDDEPKQSAPKTTFRSTIPRCVPLHGSLQSLVCRKCSHSAPLDTPAYLQLLAEGQAVPCPSCETSEEVRSISNFRSRGVGIMKPAVVLYGEPHADADLVGSVTASDLRGARPDLLLVVGTTLKVPGTQRLVSELAKVIHPSFTAQGETEDRPVEKQLSQPKTVFLNAEFPTQAKKWASLFDVWVQSDIQAFSGVLQQMQGELAKSKKPITTKKQPDSSLGINKIFTATKSTVAAAAGKPATAKSANKTIKKAPIKASQPPAKKPANKAPKPSWEMVLAEEYNMSTSDPVVEGKRFRKASTPPDNTVNATLHVRPAQSFGTSSSTEPSSSQSSVFADSVVASTHSTPSSTSSEQDACFEAQPQLTPSKNVVGRISSASSLSAISPSPSSSEGPAKRSPTDGGCSSSPFSSSVERAPASMTRPTLDSPLQLLARVTDTKTLPPVPFLTHDSQSGHSSHQGLTDPCQYKVSDFFGAVRNQPARRSSAPTKA